MSDERPWRHATRFELRNMVHAATIRWEKALKSGNTALARAISIQLDAVNAEIDQRKTRRAR